MPPKRHVSIADSTTPSKHPKTDLSSGDDFGVASRKRPSSNAASRTGQACDRCKTRKIKCDASAGGCSPCLSVQAECKTTDRISGRTTSRGYTEAIEQECGALRQTVTDLQKQLRENGIEPKVAHPQILVGWSQGTPGADTPIWTTPAFDQKKRRVSSRGGELGASQTTSFVPGGAGDSYVGISGNSHLSDIKGTSLSVFGMEIDLADFLPDEFDEKIAPTSFKTFLDYAMNTRHSTKVKADLPSLEECQQYAGYYFRGLHPYLPVLHEQTFMKMLDHMYHDSAFRPSCAQTVMVHMVLAIIKFHYVLRNSDGSPTFFAIGEQATAHYLFSLGFIHELLATQSLEDIQALTLLCVHMRSFHKSRAALMLTNMVLSVAINLGLHRSADAWADTSPKKSKLDVEIRKRVFWVLLSIHVTLSGKLGRPMPLKEEDFDVEIPEPLDDSSLSEAAPKDERKCSFRIAIECFKIVKLYLRMYSSVYAVRPPIKYDTALRQLEAQIEEWRSQLPAHLAPSASRTGVQEDRVHALFVISFELELQLLLHHPSICRSSTPDTISRNLDICLNTSQKMIRVVEEIHQFKSLDITWYSCTLYIAFIFTTLFAYWERRDRLTSLDMDTLRADMDSWLNIINDVGVLLGRKSRHYISPYIATLVEGSDTRLHDRLRSIIDSSIDQINRCLMTKTASAAVASANLHRPSASPPTARHMAHGPSPYQNAQCYPVPYPEGATGSQNAHAPRSNSYMAADEAQMGPNQSPYAPAQYSYPDPSTSANPPYPQHNYPFDGPYAMQQRDSINQSNAPPHAHSQAQQPPPNAFLYGPPTGPHFHAPNAPNGYGGAGAWKQFTANMRGNLGQQDYANVLMTLGGGREMMNHGEDPRAAGAHMEGHMGGVGGGGAGTWPMTVFDAGVGGAGQQ